MNMSEPFHGYTDEQAAAIHQALIQANLKPDADWPWILSEITRIDVSSL